MININCNEMAEKLNEKFGEKDVEMLRLAMKDMQILRLMRKRGDFDGISFKPNKKELGPLKAEARAIIKEIDIELAKMIDVFVDDFKNNDKTLLNPHSFDKHRNSVGLNGDVVEVDLNPPQDSTAVVVVAHEFGHLLNQSIQIRIQPRSIILEEVAPMFLERCVVEYLHKTHKIDDEEYENFKKLRDMNFNRALDVIEHETELIKTLGHPIAARDIEETESVFAGMKRWERMVDTMQKVAERGSQGRRMLQHLYGNLISEVLFADYLKDPVASMERFKDFVEHNAGFGAEQPNSREYLKTNMERLLGNDFKGKFQNMLGTWLSGDGKK